MRRQAPINANLFINAPSSITEPMWLEWFQRLCDYYDQVGQWVDPYAPNFGKIEPPARYKVNGVLVFADGTNWNPGSGAGYYRWNAGGAAWVKIG